MNFKYVLLLMTFCLPLSTMAAKEEFYIDCSNYCAFNEFEDNCHGVAYKKKKKDGNFDFEYTHYSKLKNACVAKLKKIKISEVQNHCSCSELNPPLPEKDAPIKSQTLEELKVLKSQIQEWAQCAPNPMTIPAPTDDQKPITINDVGSCKTMAENGQDPYIILGGCVQGTYFNHCDYYGNTNNLAGPQCLAGDMDRCRDIKLNQDPETGAWYRSAYQRRFPYSERGQPLFSRDEMLGIFHYFAKTKDKESAELWLRFLVNNPKKNSSILGKLWKIHNICPYHPGGKPIHITDKQWEDMLADDRCEMRPSSWGEMYQVYRYIGFTDDELKKIDKTIYTYMKLNSPFTKIISDISVRVGPRYTYEMALQAETMLLINAIGFSKNAIIKDTTRMINKRTGHESPLYHFVANENKATEYGAHLIKKYCPSSMPNYVKPPQGGIGRPQASYMSQGVHFFNGVKDGWDAVLPTGHECLAWINLYLNAKN